MKSYKYEVSLHDSAQFQEVAYFCTPEGSCRPEAIPGAQLANLSGLLNERGREGWELVQLFFGKQGLALFWKKEI